MERNTTTNNGESKMTKEQKYAYRGGFIQCMRHFSTYSVDYIKDIAFNEVPFHHTEFFTKGYQDAYNSWMGFTGLFVHENEAYSLRENEYKNYWGQGNFVHPNP